MCGIVGIGDFKPHVGQHEHNLFAQMLVGNALRGTDSTGIVKVFVDGQFDWRKQIGYPYRLWESPKFNDWWKNHIKKEVRFLIGHCRYSTRGESSVDNAHPFTQGNITLVHNGTLANFCDLPDFKTFKVDSEAIANSINIQGIQKTVDGMIGAYAIVYYDGKEKTLNLIRNHERPLFLGVDENIGRIYFGSEPKLIEWVLNRNESNLEGFKIKEIPTNELISFSLNSLVPKRQTIKKKFIFHTGSQKEWWETYQSEKEKEKNKTDTVSFQGLSLPAPKKEDQATGSGKLIQIETRQQKKAKNKKQKGMTYTSNSDFRVVDNLLGMKIGERIRLDILDYNKINGHVDRYLVECCHPEYPMVDVFLYIQGKHSMDGLLETGILTGRIVSLEQNINSTKSVKSRHKIWAKDPIPRFNFEKKVIETSLSEAEEAEVIEDLKRGTLFDHRDPALGD